MSYFLNWSIVMQTTVKTVLSYAIVLHAARPSINGGALDFCSDSTDIMRILVKQLFGHPDQLPHLYWGVLAWKMERQMAARPY